MPKRVVDKTLNFIDRISPLIYVGLIVMGALTITILTMFLLSEVHKTNNLVKQTTELTLQNKQLILEIQANRIESCRLVYGSYLLVFGPFFPPPQKRTPIQNHNWKILKKQVTTLKRGCPKQIRLNKKEATK